GGGGGGPAAGTPSAPQNVSASYNASLQQLTVTWNPPATDNGSGIVQYRASTADGRAECYAAPSANSCTISASDVPIPFRKPYNDRNASQPESDWVLYNTTGQAAEYLRASAENGDQAAVSWANGVYAQARNAVGWGALGFAVAQPKRPPGAPTDVVATGKYKAVTVSYKAPADLGNPSGIAAYLVRTDTGQACITRVTAENPLECTYTDLKPGTKYTFKVQALGAAGWGEFSSVSNSASPYDLKLDVLSRPEVKFLLFKRGSNLEAEGRAPGLRAGTELTPVLQLGADGALLRLTKDTAKVDRDGNFTWSRKLDKKDNGKPASLYFTYGNDKTATLTAKLGATIGLPSAPRDVKVKSDTSGFTVSWKPPARDGGSPISEYLMTSDVRAPSWAQSKFVSCTVKAPATSCTMPGSTTVFDPNKTYTFSVVAKTERGTGPQATKKWKGEIYRLNIFKRARIDSEILLSFTAIGWAKDARGFEIQAKVGENGTWKKQGTASLDPDYVEPIGDWIGMLPKSSTAGSTVFYRVKSDKGFSNEVRFRLSSSFEYSFG
ncbi:MAG TPA: hypothetical protein DCQ36_11380, partial [Actinobacteria bacterium]|nr:hypothetical protein [Actinomycetota bacterium]